jgi:NAD-dependent deacetylase
MLESLIQLLQGAKHIEVFTGAGVSTLSGIRDFRGTGGFYTAAWHGLSVEDLLSLHVFRDDPSLFYGWAREFLYRLKDFKPSIVHTTLAKMEQNGLIRGVYTQNIDQLHQKGGCKHVWEIHGSPESHTCLSCKAKSSYDDVVGDVMANKVPLCKTCGGVLKPDIVFYGEQLEGKLLDRAYRDMASADVIMILGSSLTVQPAASLPMATYYHGGKIVIVNSQETPLDKYAKVRLYDLQETFAVLNSWLDQQNPGI